MALLAYDPDRISRLRGALADASIDLRGVRCTDPAAADAMRVVRAAVAQLDATWLPLVTRLLDSNPLSSSQRHDAHIHSLDQSLIRVMADGYGWSVQHDPLSDVATTVTVEEARALGAMLNGVDSHTLASDPAQLAWLAQQLAVIGRDPALSAEFLANFHNWASLCDGLSSHRAWLLSGFTAANPAAIAALDEVFLGLAQIQQHHVPLDLCTVAADFPLPQIDEMDPYSAALLLRHLQLDGTTRAFLTDHLLQRWFEAPLSVGDGNPDTDADYFDGPNTADILFTSLLTDPAACLQYLQRAVGHPETLFEVANDPELAFRVVLAGTDPAIAEASLAGRIVVPLIEYFHDNTYRCDIVLCDGGGGHWRLFLADLVSPWLLQFTPLNQQFSDDPDRTKRSLRFVFADTEARQRVLSNADSISRGVRLANLASADGLRVEEVAAVIAMLYRQALETDVHDEKDRQAQSDAIMTVASVAASIGTGLLPLVGATAFLAGAAVDAGGAGLQMMLSGKLFDPEGVEDAGEYRQDLAMTAAAADVLDLATRQLVANGLLPVTVLPTPGPNLTAKYPDRELRIDFDEWVTRHQIPADQRDILENLIKEFANGAMVADNVFARA